MSAPVNSAGSFENEKAPASRSGAFAIYLAVWLGRACPLSKLNQAQKAQKRYEEKACACHVLVDLNERGSGPGCTQDTKFRP